MPYTEYPPDVIPKILLGGSVNLLAGASGVGKTALLASMMVKLRDNQPVFGRQPNPVPRIGVLSIDRSWAQSSAHWYRLAGWEDIPHYCIQDDQSFNIDLLGNRSKRLDILKRCLDQLDRLYGLPFGSLIIIDPAAAFLGGNLMDYDACMVACSKLRRLALQRGVTFIGAVHASKQKNNKKEQYRRLQDRIMGSAAQLGFTDSQLYLASPEEIGERFYTFLWNSHHAKPEVFPLERSEDGLFVPQGQGVVSKESQAVFAHLPTTEEGVGFGELILVSGVSKSSVWRVLQEGMKDGTVEKVGHGKYRRLPSTTPAH